MATQADFKIVFTADTGKLSARIKESAAAMGNAVQNVKQLETAFQGGFTAAGTFEGKMARLAVVATAMRGGFMSARTALAPLISTLQDADKLKTGLGWSDASVGNLQSGLSIAQGIGGGAAAGAMVGGPLGAAAGGLVGGASALTAAVITAASDAEKAGDVVRARAAQIVKPENLLDEASIQKAKSQLEALTQEIEGKSRPFIGGYDMMLSEMSALFEQVCRRPVLRRRRCRERDATRCLEAARRRRQRSL